MKKFVLAATIVAAGFAFSSNAEAAEKINPWKHCGIGAMIFDDNGTAAAISNIIWDLGTTAVSSNISSQESCKGQRVAAAQFLQDTIALVEEETVIGNGVHLTTVLNLMGCESSSHDTIAQDLRANLDLTSDAKAETYFHQMEATIQQNYSAQCAVI